MESIVIIIINILVIYVIAGLLFSFLFIWKGLDKVDPATEGTSIWFRMIIIPGLCAFWPLFLSKWIKR